MLCWTDGCVGAEWYEVCCRPLWLHGCPGAEAAAVIWHHERVCTSYCWPGKRSKFRIRSTVSTECALFLHPCKVKKSFKLNHHQPGLYFHHSWWGPCLSPRVLPPLGPSCPRPLIIQFPPDFAFTWVLMLASDAYFSAFLKAELLCLPLTLQVCVIGNLLGSPCLYGLGKIMKEIQI